MFNTNTAHSNVMAGNAAATQHMDKGKYDHTTSRFKTHGDVMTGNPAIAQQDQDKHKRTTSVFNTNPAHVQQTTLLPPWNTWTWGWIALCE